MNKLKKIFNGIKRWYGNNKSIASTGVFLLIFPIILGLIYKIPLKESFIDIGLSDLLQFYAVALGLFFSVTTYKKEEYKKYLIELHDRQPKFNLGFRRLDDLSVQLLLDNPTKNDFIVNYISLDMFDISKKAYLNSCKKIELECEYTEESYPSLITIDCIDVTNGNKWNLCFELQENTNSYCRTCIDPV